MELERVAEKLATPKPDLSRRALVKAGWVVPVVLALGIPKNAMAQSASGGTINPPPPNPSDDV